MDENLKQFSWSLAVAVSASFGIHLVKSKTFELRSVEGRCLQFLEGRKGKCNNWKTFLSGGPRPSRLARILELNDAVLWVKWLLLALCGMQMSASWRHAREDAKQQDIAMTSSRQNLLKLWLLEVQQLAPAPPATPPRAAAAAGMSHPHFKWADHCTNKTILFIMWKSWIWWANIIIFRHVDAILLRSGSQSDTIGGHFVLR